MKKILFIPYYFYPDISAISQLFTEFIFRLAQDKRYEITVLSTSSEYSGSKDGRNVAVPDNVVIKKIKSTNFRKNSLSGKIINFFFFYVKVFFYLLFGKKHDCVVTLTLPPLIQFSAALASYIRKTTLIFYVQDLYPEILYDFGIIKNPWIVRRLKIFNRIVIKKAEIIITIGSFMKQKIENYEIPDKNIKIIHNWPNHIQYNDPEKKDFTEILYSGNIGIPHDLSLLNDLLNDNEMINENLYFHFIGGGRNYSKTRAMFENGRCNYRFESYADIEKVSGNLSDADILLIAQKKESVGDIVPSKFYSYLASGRPVIFIGPRESEIGEIIIKNDIGVVYEDEHDMRKIKDFIFKIKYDFENYTKICRRIKTISDNFYSLDTSLLQFKGILEEVL